MVRKLPALLAAKHRHLLDFPSEYESCTVHHHLKRQDTWHIFPHTKKDNYIKAYNIFKMLLQWFALLQNSSQWNTIMKICYKSGTELNITSWCITGQTHILNNNSSHLVWQEKNYLNAKNTFQWNNFTTCIAVPSLSPRQHQQKNVIATYNTQSSTGISSMEALPHIKSASTGASHDSHSA